jgi:hypothetical protein
MTLPKAKAKPAVAAATPELTVDSTKNPPRVIAAAVAKAAATARMERASSGGAKAEAEAEAEAEELSLED